MTSSWHEDMHHVYSGRIISVEQRDRIHHIARFVPDLPVEVYRKRVSANKLTGTIPPELGTLSKLEAACLGGNQLTGTIPSEPSRDLDKLLAFSTLGAKYYQRNSSYNLCETDETRYVAVCNSRIAFEWMDAMC